MKIILLNATTSNEEWHKIAVELYKKKIKHYLPIEIKTIKQTKNQREDSRQKKESESKEFLAEITKDDFVILLDEKGKQQDSREFSKTISTCMMSGKKRIVFVVGGAYGLSEEIKSKGHLQISFSKMTFNHLVAEIVLLEQIFRSFTIITNIPYHND